MFRHNLDASSCAADKRAAYMTAREMVWEQAQIFQLDNFSKNLVRSKFLSRRVQF